jgi:drug/metabolite transporter (DMT)-like permease
MLYIGEIAAIITSILFALTSTMFTLAGREVGSLVVNRLRLAGASALVLIVHWIVMGTLWPVQAGVERWIWLGLSGIIGFVLGDAFLFQAFIWVGPRLSMLMMSLAPILAAFIAWIFLGESLSGSQILGILVTILGLIWVVVERNSSNEVVKENYIKGILFGLGAAIGQAVGFVMSKLGLAGNFSPLSGNYIRLISALVVIWLVALVRREALSTIKEAGKHPNASWKILAGAFSGPFLGVLLSLFALQNTSVGIASTLIALPPLFLLPVDFFIFKEEFGWGAVAGTGIALGGVAILFLA